MASARASSASCRTTRRARSRGRTSASTTSTKCWWRPSRPDELGFDLIAVGNVCSFACEAQEKGILTAADLGGIQLKWGETEGFIKLMDLIALRKGEIPTLLGEGLTIAAKKIGKGSEKFAMVSKGIEWGAHGARSGRDANALSYSVGSQGGDHMSRANATGEGSIFTDSTGLCSFQRLSRDQQVEWMQAITGFGYTADDITKLTPRMTTEMRIPLLLHGWTYKDDVNPGRAYEPLPDGPFKGNKVEKTVEKTMIDAFYQAMGWDSQGVPTTETLAAHGFSAFDAALAPLRAKA